MRKLFWSEPYRTNLDTAVESVNGREVTLKETIFYAFFGGQESDSGTIGGIEVSSAERRDESIVYTLRDDHDLSPGDPVTVEID